MVLHEPKSRTQVVSIDGDDDYIDMELSFSSSSPCSPSSRFISFAVTSSPPRSREFEFQMCSSAVASSKSSTSPADELFYKGQLLPLHLPPRLQMVQKLLAETITPSSPRAAASSPRRFIENNENSGEPSSKKIKHSSITQKLKASRAYIRALFSKPRCSDSSEIHPKFNLESIETSKSNNNPQLLHRRSFSGVVQRHSSQTKSCSSSSSSSLSSSFSFGSLDIQTLMRSSNVGSELDNSIEGAIEHCKQSFTARKSNVAESELFSSRNSVSTSSDFQKELR